MIAEAHNSAGTTAMREAEAPFARRRYAPSICWRITQNFPTLHSLVLARTPFLFFVLVVCLYCSGDSGRGALGGRPRCALSCPPVSPSRSFVSTESRSFDLAGRRIAATPCPLRRPAYLHYDTLTRLGPVSHEDGVRTQAPECRKQSPRCYPQHWWKRRDGDCTR